MAELSERPWIFSIYPQMKGKVRYCSLGDYPSPVTRLNRLSEKTGADIWIKRDDIASCVYGGNKCRMMEWIIPDAVSKGRKSLVTWGALGSNQVLSSVIFGRKKGFDDITAVYNRQPYQSYVKKNFLIATALGVKQVFGSSMPAYAIKLAAVYLGKLLAGKRPYLIPLLGSSPLSVISYMDAALELRRQIEAGECPPPDYLYVTVGTGGTFAGLVLGSRLFGDIGEVTGVRILERAFVSERIVAWEINRTIRFLRKIGVETAIDGITGRDIRLLHDFYGKGYAEATGEGLEAIKLLADLEDIRLDVTYTGKTMAALIRHAEQNPGRRYLFWHTLNTLDLNSFTEMIPDRDEIPRCFRKELEN